jgi:biopolymer transport protein ExbD
MALHITGFCSHPETKTMSVQTTKAPSAAVQNADLNVTPLVDILLVLLIIFMVAAPLATVSFRLDLPPAMIDGSMDREPVYISVSESGSIHVADKASSLETLSADVCAAQGGGDCRNERVFVRGEPETSYRSFMAVMNDLEANGFFKVGLLNEDIR